MSCVGSRVEADVAILFDWESWWALELGWQAIQRAAPAASSSATGTTATLGAT